jgi:hypothetical protein
MLKSPQSATSWGFFSLGKGNCSAPCHPFDKLRTGFEAEGREIPEAQQVKAAWLDTIYGQSPPFTS